MVGIPMASPWYRHDILSSQVKRDPVFAKRIALTALMGPSGPALSPGRVVAPPALALPATPRTPSLVEESAAESPVRKARNG